MSPGELWLPLLCGAIVGAVIGDAMHSAWIVRVLAGIGTAIFVSANIYGAFLLYDRWFGS